MKHIIGNILDWPETEGCEKVFSLQQVNCMGKFGAGLAKQTAIRYPQVKQDYLDAFNDGTLKLGSIIESKVSPTKSIILMAAQKGYGTHRRQTDYVALDSCFNYIWPPVYQAEDEGIEFKVLIPYKMSCGLAGGDWFGKVRPMIHNYFPNAVIVALPRI